PGAPDGASALIARARKQARELAPKASPLIVLGEHGAGKDVLARFVHARSGRAPLVVVHPGGFVDESAPVVLFGDPRVDDAAPGSTGLVAAADGGTVILDD